MSKRLLSFAASSTAVLGLMGTGVIGSTVALADAHSPATCVPAVTDFLNCNATVTEAFVVFAVNVRIYNVDVGLVKVAENDIDIALDEVKVVTAQNILNDLNVANLDCSTVEVTAAGQSASKLCG
jgi:hypothetical protein